MEAALVTVATGVLKPVLGKLATLLGDEYKRFKGVRKEIRSLTHELAAMEAFLLKMSEEEEDPDVQDKVWMNEVRELSYDMEDAIDDFMQSIGDKDEKPDGFTEKIKATLGKLGNMKARHRIGKEIHDLKKQIIEVGDRNARYKGREIFSKAVNATVDPRALAIFEHASKLVGIDEPKAELIKLLTDEDGVASTQEQVKMVCIVGSGGMGKTTLANQVYQEMKEEFKFKAFISVSRNPDMMNILRTLLSEIGCQDYAHTEAGSIQQLISKITDYLAEKRYFIVIDDIWDVKTWDVIKCAFPMTRCGGVIITTTRLSDVACSCHSSIGGHIYNIRPLNMEHSRQLFYRRLFSSEEDCPSSLVKVSYQILEKCDGLPLAIIAIAGLLANTGRSEHQWNQVKDSIGRALERNPSVEVMIKILSLSYFDLPPHLKTCLLYLSIFPEDSIIEKKTLISRWIAEGFIRQEGRYTAYEVGVRCFNELVNRSLIQPVKKDDYKGKSCRVHDIILDFIVSKSIEENFVTFVGVPSLTTVTQGKVRRLSMQVEEKVDSILPMSLILSHVRSLNMFGNTVSIPSIMELRHLRVLDFGGNRLLENRHLAYVGMLFQLRYLNIYMTAVSELPEQIGHLQCLEMLDIRHTWVSELPASIANLGKLAHLLLSSNTGTNVKFPDGIAKMQSLEALHSVNTCNQSYNFLQGLGQLKNLRKLGINYRGVAHEDKEVIASSLGKLCTQNLCSLTMWNDDDDFLLNTWCTSPPLNLRKLVIWGCIFPKVPHWVGSLVNLQKLHLEVGRGTRHEDICILGALPALFTLGLRGSEKQPSCENRRLAVSGEAGFRCLRKFKYWRWGDWMDLMFTAKCMPRLEKLKIIFYGHAEDEAPIIPAFDFGIENLSSLTTFKCHLGYGPMATKIVDAVKASLDRVVSAHPNHLTLIFTYCCVFCKSYDCGGRCLLSRDLQSSSEST
uniref:Stem rust resistance protein CC-NB-LRR n=1 Tax=x Triticosecale sp. Coorong TaxID=2870833 RepID=A0A8G1H4H3_9POAL|nr:stem rust resistance protein CC-NB-LRR [x Triticosecale sp. Coorong]